MPNNFFKTTIAYDNWVSKYRYKHETPLETFQRVAKALSSVEKKNKEHWYNEFLKVMIKFDNENNPTGLKCTTGGRITANAGTEFSGATLLNCYINGPITNATIEYSRKSFDDKIKYPVKIKSENSPDNLINIFLAILEQAKTLASEGGYGINFSFIRPRGTLINSIGIKHPGVVSYMQIWDAVSECIVKGDNDGYKDKLFNYLDDTQINDLKKVVKEMARKGAMLGCLNVDHPDIEEFIRAKQTSGKLTKFNLSVAITDEFMNAVINDDLFELKFEEKVYKKVKAKDLYDLIMESTYNRAEPGVLYIDNMHKNNPISYIGKANATNPCIIGNSIIAVADGRNGVSIKQLTDEGKDVPVYSKNKITGVTEIKYGRNPRKTGEKKEVWKVTFDDDSHLIATPDHGFLLTDGTEKQLKDLIFNDSLIPFNTYLSNGYRQITASSIRTKQNGLHLSRRQYRLIFEFYNPEIEITKEHRIHHSNFNSLDDNPQFLKLCTKEEHAKIHDISGTKNPMFRLKDRKKYHDNMSKAVSGLKNPRAFKITTIDLFSNLVKFTKNLGRRPKRNELFNYCKINNFPLPQKFRLNELNCNGHTQIIDLLEKTAFVNHKVKSIEFYGYEDVYNMTVDDNHNYMVITKYDDEKFVNSSGICIKNCGEIPGVAELTSVCLLGSINLTQYVLPNRIFDFEQYKKDIIVFTRMLDNVNDLSSNPIPTYDWAMKNFRQIGMGINGLGSTMIMLGISYDSAEASKFTKEVCEIKENLTMQASALLAQEKGCFPVYVKEEYEQTEYFKSDRLWKETKKLIKDYGVRNAKTTTNPPLGNSSVVCDNVSNGIEPIFSLEYERKIICSKWPEGLTKENVKKVLKEKKEKDFVFWRGNFEGKEYYYEPHNRGLCEVNIVKDYGYNWVLEHFSADKKANYLLTTNELAIDSHLKIQEIVQYYCNQSVSKTCNVPNKFPMKDFKSLYIDAWKRGLNGFTTYRDGSMESVMERIEKAGKKREIIKQDLKLPEEFLNGPTKIIVREGTKYYLHFSYLPDDKEMKFPIVIWIYTNEFKGQAVATNRAVKRLENLALECGIQKRIVDAAILKAENDLPYNKLSRMISLNLRHNVPIENIYEALLEIEGDNISSLLSAVRKFLTNRLDDGVKLSKTKCKQCGSSNIVMQSGCQLCVDCGMSGCG